MELTISNTYMNFSRHQFCCFTIVPLFVLDKSMASNRCLQHPCFKKLIQNCSSLQKFRFQHPTLPFGFANTFMMFTPCSSHSQVTNSLILSWIGVSLPYVTANSSFSVPSQPWLLTPPVLHHAPFWLCFWSTTPLPKDRERKKKAHITCSGNENAW
jgi:hypothetical protein